MPQNLSLDVPSPWEGSLAAVWPLQPTALPTQNGKTQKGAVGWFLSLPSSLGVASFSSVFWKYALSSYFYLHMYDHGTRVKIKPEY